LKDWGLINQEKSILLVPTRRSSRRWSQALHTVARQEEKRHKLKQKSFRLRIRRSCFPGRTARQWNRDPERLCTCTGGFKMEAT